MHIISIIIYVEQIFQFKMEKSYLEVDQSRTILGIVDAMKIFKQLLGQNKKIFTAPVLLKTYTRYLENNTRLNSRSNNNNNKTTETLIFISL